MKRISLLLLLVLLALGLVMTFGVGVQAQVTGLPHVFNLTFNDQGNPGKDSSENGNNGELKGGAKWVANGYFGGAVQLDGNGGHVEVVVDVPEKNFTMGVWIKTDSGDVGIYSVLDGAAGAGGHDRHFFLSGGKINFRTWQGPGWPTDKNVADGKWHHIALVVEDKKGQTAYVDGENVGTHTYDHSDFNWQKRVWVGFSNDAGQDYFKGLIDEASYTAAALTGDQVKMELMVPLTPGIQIMHVVSPPSVQQKFVLPFQAFTSIDLQTFSFGLSFNPSIVKATDVEYGDFLSKNGADPTTCETPKIDTAKGRITGIVCRRNTEDGVTGTGVLATINFEAIGVGESALIIEKASFSNPKGEAIEFTTRDGKVTVYGPHADITGQVTDPQGNPVSGVEMVAFLNDQSVGINDETDWSGNYLIDNITQTGRVTVKAIKSGEIPIKPVEVDVRIGQATENVDFTIFEPTAFHSVVDSKGFIRNWLLLGSIPWENDTTRLMSDQLNPKIQADSLFPVQEIESKELRPVDGDFGNGLAQNHRWSLHVDNDGEDSWIRLDRVYQQSPKGVAYAFSRIKSPNNRKFHCR